MSRRHHGGRSRRGNGHGHAQAPLASTQAAPGSAPVPRHVPPPHAAPAPRDHAPETPPDANHAREAVTGSPVGEAPPTHGPIGLDRAPAAAPAIDPSQAPRGPGGPPNESAGCTAPQLRRFIKSRPYVPMHELRRRFGINGAEDDVTVVEVDGTHVFVGLPAREGGLLGELLRGGEVGYELSLDPRSPVVVGLYPMRPVPRS
jgi:hypothetical protein